MIARRGCRSWRPGAARWSRLIRWLGQISHERWLTGHRLTGLFVAAAVVHGAVVDPVLKVWSMERNFINTYKSGTWGPRGTYRLFDRDDQFWRHSLDVDGAELHPY